jgi:Na+-driven multidrug efflux pump
MTAFAQGGSVVLAQYIGARDENSAKNALKTNVKIVFAIGFIVMALMIGFKSHVLSFLFGGAEKDVIENSLLYFSYTAISYPFFLNMSHIT